MYMVVSYWEPLPGKEADAQLRSGGVAETLRRQPGVEFLERFQSEDGKYIAVVVYRDEETYHRLIDDPDGEFVRAAAASGIEQTARWVRSERGETLPHA